MTSKAKPTVLPFKRRALDEGSEETPLPRLPKPRPPEAVSLDQKAVDLTGKPKIWFVIGRGGVGKTTMIRWAAETVDQDGGQMTVAAVDPLNRALTMYRQDVEEPPSNDPAEVAPWLQELLLHCMEANSSAMIDLGGGDVSLNRLLATAPDLVDVLSTGGVEPVAIHVVGSNPHDLVPLAETEDAGFQPRATAIVLNERLDPRDRFGPILRHSVYRSATERGAVPIWMPYLTRDVARLVEARHMPFMSVGNTLGPFNGAAVRLWLRSMEAEFAPIRSWFPS